MAAVCFHGNHIQGRSSRWLRPPAPSRARLRRTGYRRTDVLSASHRVSLCVLLTEIDRFWRRAHLQTENLVARSAAPPIDRGQNPLAVELPQHGDPLQKAPAKLTDTPVRMRAACLLAMVVPQLARTLGCREMNRIPST